MYVLISINVNSATELHQHTVAADMTTDQGLRNFDVPASVSQVDAISLRGHMTLRNACLEYKHGGGISWVEHDVPEASAGQSADQIPCINRFQNCVGHVVSGVIMCYPIQMTNTIVDMISVLTERLQESIDYGKLWVPYGTVKYTFTGKRGYEWSQGGNYATKEELQVLKLLYSSHPAPLSGNTTHAAMEANHFDSDDVYKEMYLYPHNAAMSVGLIGSLADNQCIDMSPGEERKQPNREKRQYDSDMTGFICSGHTSHSGEAGRVRRVTCDTSVRILTQETVDILTSLLNDESLLTAATSDLSWTVFCMGIYCRVSASQMNRLCALHQRLSYGSQYTKFSLHIDTNHQFVNISVSSGALVKLTSSGRYADNVEVHYSHKIRGIIRPIINTTGPDFLRACFSSYFCLGPYMDKNRPPRPLISSVQQPQAVCLPWCPGDAAVAPCYSFNPMVVSDLYDKILGDVRAYETNFSCLLPGENVVVMYCNQMGNYEDAIEISQRYVDNGGFSTVSMCSYNVSQNEYIPPVGSVMCSKLSKWWKSPCQPECTHDPEELLTQRRITTGYTATGVVHSVTYLPNGDVNVRIRSHQHIQQGDKLSMPHGQKGVCNIRRHEDMPIAYSSKHGHIYPDIVVAMSSIVTRQTNGVLYEACKSMNLAKDLCSLPAVVSPCEVSDVSDEFTAVDGETLEPIMTALTLPDGTVVVQPAKVTVGINRVMNQTQMSRERHHISHTSPGKNSLRTVDGRGRGGGVTYGEMEEQTTSASGMHSCGEEISERGDRVVVPVCTTCQRLGLLCTCTTEDNFALTKLPYDLVVLDCVTAIVHNGSFQYKLAPELR